MNKMDVIHRLREARRAHTQWVGRARSLISGLGLEKESVPVLPTDCSFGSWYYGDGQALSVLPSFKKIEIPHSELHRIYMEIFSALFKEKEADHSLLSRLFGRSHEQTDAEKLDEAKEKLIHLEKISHDIVELIQSLENEVFELSDEEFGDYIEARV